MAKNKTAEKAKIEAAPVLRSGGDDPTPETPVITKSYIMRDDWIDKGVVNTVAFKSVDGEVDTVFVNGEPAGGGGTSFVSVEIINNKIDNLFNGDYNISSVLSDQSEAWDLPAGTLIYPMTQWEGPTIEVGSRYTVQNIVIAGNGNAIIFFSSVSDTYNVTGSITRVNDFQHGALFIITGPGTITLS